MKNLTPPCFKGQRINALPSLRRRVFPHWQNTWLHSQLRYIGRYICEQACADKSFGRPKQSKERFDMITQTNLITVATPADFIRSSRGIQTCGTTQEIEARLQFAYNGGTSVESQPMRISRRNRVIGEWLPAEVKEHLENGTLLLNDSFYDKAMSEWLPLSDLQVSSVKAKKTGTWPCYCGTGLPFQVCCGNGTNY